MKTITVVMLDDHYLIRQGIRSLLADKQDINLVGEGSAGEHLAVLLQEHQPDVVLLDIGMPQKEALDPADRSDNSFRVLPAIARLRNQYPGTQVIIVSQYESRAIIEGALELGVRGYLLKDDALSLHLAEAIRAVWRGGFYFSNEIGERLARGKAHLSQEVVLTERQQEIIQLIADSPNLPYAQIAVHMGISLHTFKNHLRIIYKKLDATNKGEALVNSLRMGIISLASLENQRQEPR